jgi:methylenetetrahydrofolate reductase (NADPH)
MLDLIKPIYRKTAAYGHFGRELPEFSWERTDKAEALRVRFIRDRYGDHFRIEVGCYPEFHPDSRSPSMDLRHFREKVEQGADAAITQYFYNADAYFQYVDRARADGVAVPIIPGIMPIINVDNLMRFSAKCGAEIPRWLGYRITELRDDKEGLLRFGVEQVTRLCETLIEGGAPGLHVYSMNQSRAPLAILRNLGLAA